MSEMGHFLDVGAFLNEARSTPKNGHRQFDPLLPKSADSVAKVPKAAAAKFSPKNETSDNRRSIEPQTRCL